MHWCADETLAAMSAVPVVGYFFRRVHNWYHSKMHHKCHHEGCSLDHAEHLTSDGEVMLPNPPGRTVISMEAVDKLFGELATILLVFDRRLIKSYTFPEPSEFIWFAQGKQLSARWKNKFFAWNGQDWEVDTTYPVHTSNDVTSDNRMICNVENTLELLHSIKRFSVADGFLEAWFEDDECSSSITEFIPGSFTRELLELIEDHITGSNGKGTGSSS